MNISKLTIDKYFAISYSNCLSKKRLAYRIFVGTPEGRRPLERPRHRWEENIKVDLYGVGCGAWTGLIWLRIGTGGGLL
jgi:hypothetical protein